METRSCRGGLIDEERGKFRSDRKTGTQSWSIRITSRNFVPFQPRRYLYFSHVNCPIVPRDKLLKVTCVYR